MEISKMVSFTGGLLLGSVGLTALTSKFAQKGYKYAIAAGMIARDRIMEDYEQVQAVVADATEDAKVLTEKYYKELDKEYEEECVKGHEKKCCRKHEEKNEAEAEATI